jgi:glycosyltransferase involved in cell wall biosynthesis
MEKNPGHQKALGKERGFVLYRDDRGIPPDREITRMETELRVHVGYPKVSIIIPTSDAYRNGLFPALLRQLSDQGFQDFETIIIKGDSRQGRAINTGAAMARGRYLLTLDDDTHLVSKDAIEILCSILERYESIGMAGGINGIPADASAFVRRVMREIPRRSTPPVNEITDSDLAEHPLLIMRKDVFTEVGGENELIPRGLDPYLRREFRNAGYRVVVVPGVHYSHLPPDSLSSLIKQFYRNGRLAAFCNRFYPHWVFETPDTHRSEFLMQRPFRYRAARYLLNMLKRFCKGHLIYLTVSIAYAAGFIKGYMCYKDETQA